MNIENLENEVIRDHKKAAMTIHNLHAAVQAMLAELPGAKHIAEMQALMAQNQYKELVDDN